MKRIRSCLESPPSRHKDKTLRRIGPERQGPASERRQVIRWGGFGRITLPKTARGYSVCSLHPLACSRQQGRPTVYSHRRWWLGGLLLSAGYREVAGPIPSMAGIKVLSLRHGEEGSAPVHSRHTGVGATNAYTSGLCTLLLVPCPHHQGRHKRDGGIFCCLAGSYSLSRDLPKYMQEDLPATTEVRTHQCRCGHFSDAQSSSPNLRSVASGGYRGGPKPRELDVLQVPVRFQGPGFDLTIPFHCTKRARR